MKSIAILVALVLLSFGASAQHNETRKPQKIDSLLVVPKELKTNGGVANLGLQRYPVPDLTDAIARVGYVKQVVTYHWKVEQILFMDIEYLMSNDSFSHLCTTQVETLIEI